MPFQFFRQFQSIQMLRFRLPIIFNKVGQDASAVSASLSGAYCAPRYSTSFCVHSSLFPTISISLSFALNFPFISLLSLLPCQPPENFDEKNIVKVAAANKPTIMNCLYFSRCVCFLTWLFYVFVG